MFPKFSFVIPTKNRPKYLQETLSSLLNQSYQDFEIIVSDDSDNGDSLQAISHFKNDSHLKYMKPPHSGMTMTEHFEWATSQSSGEYTLLFPDRSILLNGALEVLDKIISSNHEIDAIYYPWLCYDEKKNIFIKDHIPNMASGYKNNREIAARFLSEPENLYVLPRNLNTCYSRTLANNIRNEFGALFMPLNPDFSFAFLLLASQNRIFYLNQPLFISQGLSISTGNKLATGYLHDMTINEMFQNTPLKIPVAINTFFEDFLRIQKIASANLADLKIPPDKYAIAVYKEMMYKRNLFGLQGFKKAQNQFAEYTSTLPASEKIKLNSLLKSLVLFRLKCRFINSPLSGVVKSTKRDIDNLISGNKKYKSVLEAAGFNH